MHTTFHLFIVVQLVFIDRNKLVIGRLVFWSHVKRAKTVESTPRRETDNVYQKQRFFIPAKFYTFLPT